jgi:sugar phosphate isomerase/epimerase
VSGLGINLGFAIKRWPEPEALARLVAEELGLASVQFTFDLLDPLWPEPARGRVAARVRTASEEHGVAIHSAQIGLAAYTYNGLLDPDPDLRAVAEQWWLRAIEVTAAIGGRAVGGPVGALSVAGAAERAARHGDAVEALARIAERAAGAGLEALLVEPTPLPREIPSTIEEASRLAGDLRGLAVPVRWVLDVGHALYRPLYGEDVVLADWLAALGGDVGVLHLQNHDFSSDAHWGWPDDRGRYDVAAFAADVRDAGVADVPVVVELFYPFEAADDAVLASVRSTVEHCREALAAR